MQFTTHETDLQILCENVGEELKFLTFCKANKIKPEIHYSNVKGQDWFGKSFFEIPFRSDLQTDIEKYITNFLMVRVVYFPLESKYSIWNEQNNLIKEWFNTKEDAIFWAKSNGYEVKQ